MAKRDYLQIGRAYFEGNALEKATRAFKVVLRHDPKNWLALYYMGCIWLQKGGFGIAAHWFEEALKVRPDCYPVINNLGICYRRLNEHDKAIALFQAGLKRNVNANLLSNLGSCTLDKGDAAAAERALRRAQVLVPSHNDANWNLALALLIQKKWEEGWIQHDWGFRAKERGARPYAQKWPEFLGGSLEGKTLLVWGEQGVGDEILFCTCFETLREFKPKNVIFECHPRLETMFRRAFPWATIFGKRKDPHDVCCNYDKVHHPDGKPREACYLDRFGIDFHMPLGSLPTFCRSNDADFTTQSYLKVIPDKVRAYRDQYPGFRVGITWRGGSSKTAIHRRSIPLEHLYSLLDVPATWISLQYGEVQSEVQAAQKSGYTLHHDNYAIEDLDELLHLTAACDLVISVIQTQIHMAGGLGVPTWCLTCEAAPWKFHDGERMLWHPSVEMIRQEGDQWPIQKIADRLQLLLVSRQKDITNTGKTSSLVLPSIGQRISA